MSKSTHQQTKSFLKVPRNKSYKRKTKKNERMQGQKSTEYFSPQYVLIMFPNCVRVVYSKDTLKVFAIETDQTLLLLVNT